MAKAKKLPSGSWRVRLYTGRDEAGKAVYKSFTAPTKKEAEAAAALYAVRKKQKDEIGMTVGEAIDAYIRSKENVLSPSTIGGYRLIRRNHLQALMDVPLSDITNAAVQAEINREALRLSPKTLRNAHGLLSAALGMFLPDFTLHTTLPAKQHKLKVLPTPEQVLRAVKGTDVELPVLLGMWMGMRMSEIRGLRYGDISADGLVTIHSAKLTVDGLDVEREQTKTYGSTRQLRLPSEILALIVPCDDPSSFVVPMQRSMIYKHYRKCLADAGLTPMTFHDLRHMNASVMLQLGVPDKYAMERGGWASNDTLKNIYQHTFTDKRHDVDAQIDRYFSSIYKE